MTTHECFEVQDWLREAFTANNVQPATPARATHIAGCATCRGALLLLMVDILGEPAAPSVQCDACLDDLPAYIDHEAQAGAAAAAREYPHVWWHLWTCAECAALYDFTRMAQRPAPPAPARQRQPESTRMPEPARPAPLRRPLVRLSRSILNRILPAPSSLLGATRGRNTDPIVISEHSVEGRHLRLSLEEQSDQHCRLIIEMMPPPLGWIVVQLGSQEFRARFDEQGYALVNDIPISILIATDGPDLVLELELDA